MDFVPGNMTLGPLIIETRQKGQLPAGSRSIELGSPARRCIGIPSFTESTNHSSRTSNPAMLKETPSGVLKLVDIRVG
jgi:hypothetical protein